MKTFVCTAYHNAIITENTCRDRVILMLKFFDKLENTRYKNKNDFSPFGPIDGSQKCKDCERSKPIIKEMKKKKKEKKKDESLDDK